MENFLFREQIVAPAPRRRIEVVSGYFWTYEEESRVTRSKQCNVWRRTISIRIDLSTGRRTSTTRRRKKRFTRTRTYREYGLVCLKEMYFYDERRAIFGKSTLHTFKIYLKIVHFLGTVLL